MVTFEFQEALVLEVPDELERLYVEWSPGHQPHIEWLKTWRSPDKGKHSGITLGAYRRGKSMHGFKKGVVEVWVRCARQESATGVPWPHCFFKQVVGRRGIAEDGSIYCPACRAERPWEKRQQTEAPKVKSKGHQLSLF